LKRLQDEAFLHWLGVDVLLTGPEIHRGTSYLLDLDTLCIDARHECIENMTA
jgi:hypothetical protein